MTDWFDLNEAEETAIATFMSRVTHLRIPSPEPQAPGPADLWCKARLLAQWEATRRAHRPLDIMQPIEILGGLVAAGVLIYLSLVG
jgi:hypothetical protein